MENQRNFLEDDHRRELKVNIALVGLTGCGKSIIGEMLAHNLHYGFLDLDEWIAQQHGCSINEIFEQKGEAYFRDQEYHAIQKLEGIHTHVLALGGGTVDDADSWDRIKQVAYTVWIHTEPEEIARRLYMNPEALEQRPLIKDLIRIGDNEERRNQLTQRLKTWEKQRYHRFSEADLTIQDSFSTPEVNTLVLLRTLKERQWVI